jgi:hypothetical protein
VIFKGNQTSILVFSEDEKNDFEILYQWNVFRIYLSPSNGFYSKAYFVILDNADISYDEKQIY